MTEQTRPTDRPATEPRTYDLDTDAGRELHQRIHPNGDRCPMLDGEPCIWQKRVAHIEAEAAQGAAPLIVECPHCNEQLSVAEGAAPRAEGLPTDTAIRRIEKERSRRLDGEWTGEMTFYRCECGGTIMAQLWDAHRAEDCASRPSDERVPENEEPR